MADYLVLGLFEEASLTSETLDDLRKLGVSEDRITIMSGIPYSHKILGRKPHYERLVPIALLGAVVGFLIGIFFTVGTPLLYQNYVGGQPLIPIPPTIIVLFELTMLGTMGATFAGLLFELRFPRFARGVYDPRITEGHLGLLARVDGLLVDEVTQALQACGGQHIQKFPAQREPGPAMWPRYLFVLLILLIPTIGATAVAYAFISVPIPNQMVEQPSIEFEQGPRLAAPAAAVPIQGASVVNGQAATSKPQADARSLAVGKNRFSYICAMCHGDTGKGDGKLSGRFDPKPPDLTSSQIQSMSDNDLFLVLTNGKGQMPRQVETLLPTERWDVINYLRTLK